MRSAPRKGHFVVFRPRSRWTPSASRQPGQTPAITRFAITICNFHHIEHLLSRHRVGFVEELVLRGRWVDADGAAVDGEGVRLWQSLVFKTYLPTVSAGAWQTWDHPAARSRLKEGRMSRTWKIMCVLSQHDRPAFGNSPMLCGEGGTSSAGYTRLAWFRILCPA